MRLFHKRDGGLMIANIAYVPLYGDDTEYHEFKIDCGHTCAMCGYLTHDLLKSPNCALFFDLPEDLQAAALGEML